MSLVTMTSASTGSSLVTLSDQRSDEEVERLSLVRLSELEVGELFQLVGQTPYCDDLDNYIPEWRVGRTGRKFYDVELTARAEVRASSVRPLRLSAATLVQRLPASKQMQ